MVAAKVDEETAVRPGNIGDDTTEYLANLREALQVMHQTVVDRKWRKRLQVRAGSKGPPCNFDVGDYVLGSRVDKRVNTHKLLARWVDPFKVAELRPNSCIIKHLLTGVEYEVHGSRLKFYCGQVLMSRKRLLSLSPLRAFCWACGCSSIIASTRCCRDGSFSFRGSDSRMSRTHGNLLKDVPTKVQGYIEEVEDGALTEASLPPSDAS
ncbi:hypothetical protein PI125_g19519 [Phytophthora idaei]|nr:hypothetical protein PI125_g19519 [Phytophthora idaei]